MSTRKPTQPVTLAEMRTWQSGVMQSRMRRTMKRLSDEYLRQYNLTTMHWLILGSILDRTKTGGIRTTDLAEHLGTTLGYLTTAINALEKRGFVTRAGHGTDNRAKLLLVTPQFAKQAEVIEEGMRNVFRAGLYDKITREELEAYVTVLQKLAP